MDRCHNRRETFAQQRSNIERVFRKLSPHSVTCLGAGLMNDIPLDTFLRSDTTLRLVDWIPQIIDYGLDYSAISLDVERNPHCLFCDSDIACPERYCCHYHMDSSERSDVCDRYRPKTSSPPRCAAFAYGDLPLIHHADITEGYASEFGRLILGELEASKNWKQAFTRAISLTERLKSYRKQIPIPNDSADLLTSSMVISQFDHEPYNYFSQCGAEILGMPTERESLDLLPKVEELHERLLLNQVERHCREIRRMLAPGGSCYLSFEMFHIHPTNHGQWFMVQHMGRILDVIGRHFLFRFDILDLSETITKFHNQDSPSLVHSYVLTPKQDQA